MILLGLSGKKRSGKNTVAKLIATMTPLRVKEFAFADPLKDEVCKACGVSRKILEENKDNFRLILQGWGTDFRRRMYDDSYWINKAMKLLHTSSVVKDEADICVFTDVRFKNEASILKQIDGVIVRVKREPSLGDDHPSEIDMDDFKCDFELDNTSTLNNLASSVQMLLHRLKIPMKK